MKTAILELLIIIWISKEKCWQFCSLRSFTNDICFAFPSVFNDMFLAIKHSNFDQGPFPFWSKLKLTHGQRFSRYFLISYKSRFLSYWRRRGKVLFRNSVSHHTKHCNYPTSWRPENDMINCVWNFITISLILLQICKIRRILDPKNPYSKQFNKEGNINSDSLTE